MSKLYIQLGISKLACYNIGRVLYEGVLFLIPIGEMRGFLINIKSFFDKSMYRFLIVGCINTVLGLALMFFFYNVLNLGYWGSSAPTYVFGAVFSFFMNRSYTFSYKKKDKMSIVRFIIVQVVSYSVAYLIARPLTFALLSGLAETMNIEMRIIEQIAMVVGMGLFVVLGYLGQRYFAFRNTCNEMKTDDNHSKSDIPVNVIKTDPDDK